MTQTSLRALPPSGARTFPFAPVGRTTGPAAGGYDTASVTGVHTALLTLTPAFLDALRKVAPKKSRSKVRYVVALAMLAVMTVLGADVSSREFAIAKGSQIAARLHRTPAALPVAQAVAPAAAVPQIGAAPVVKREQPAVAPVVATVAAAKKSIKASPHAHSKMPQTRRPAVRQPGQNHSATLTAQISTREW